MIVLVCLNNVVVFLETRERERDRERSFSAHQSGVLGLLVTDIQTFESFLTFSLSL